MANLQDPRVQGLLMRACGASGFIGAFIIKVCHHYDLPVPDPDTLTIFITGATTEGAEWIVAWYRNNPNNILRRMVGHINGTSITPDTRAIVAEATSHIPGVEVRVDTAEASLAPQSLKDLANDETKAPDVIPKAA